MWPTPRSTDWKAGANKIGRSTAAQTAKAGWNLYEAVRMWPTPNVPNGGRKPKGGVMTETGMTPDGKKRQVGLENAVTMTFAEPVSSQLTLFAEAFPASRTRSLADVPAATTRATSGPNSPDSFASVDPDGSWRKTCQGYSQVTLDGSLETFCETWPRAGMTRSGTAYRRPNSAPLTDAIASGSWPTPDAGAFNLTETPSTVLARQAEQKARGINGNGFGLRLATAAQMWPTPASRDFRSPSLKVGQPEYFRAPTAGIPLPEAIGGQLNPTWVEWLMGYPLGWTALKAWGTRSSRKSPSGSAGASLKPKD
jgi:hypothetical protein